MLKLSISNSIFNAISANLLKGAAAVQHMELTHKELKQALHEDLVEKATLLEKDVDTYIKEDKESRVKRFTRMIEEMNTGSIPAVDTKTIRVSSDEDQVTIEFKTDFVEDFVNTCGDAFVVGLKASAEMFLASRKTNKMFAAFQAKWKHVPETMTSKVVPESKVPAEAKSFAEEVGKAGKGDESLVGNLEVAVAGSTYVDNNGVTLKVGLIHENIVLGEENIMQVHYLRATGKDGKEYAITPFEVDRILKAPAVDKDLQTVAVLPYSVMKAIRKAHPTLVAHYASQSK